MHLTFFGSSLVSSYWNGAATYYRGLLRALAGRGHRITFCEPDAYGRQENRDLATDPPYARVIVYRGEAERDRLIDLSFAESDAVVKCSGVGVWDRELEAAVAERSGAGVFTAFWDVDAPATLVRIENDPADPFRRHIPRYDHIFTYGGGPPVVTAYERWGTRACTPIYNGLDPEEHRPIERPDPLSWDVLFMGNRLPDREARVEEFFFHAAELCPDARFALGGEGWGDKSIPDQIQRLGHIPTARHNQGERRRPSGAQHPPRVDGGERLVTGDADVRGSGRGGVPDHGRVGGDRGLLRAGQRDPDRGRRSGCGAAGW